MKLIALFQWEGLRGWGACFNIVGARLQVLPLNMICNFYDQCSDYWLKPLQCQIPDCYILWQDWVQRSLHQWRKSLPEEKVDQGGGNKHVTCHGEKPHCVAGVWHTDWEANVRTSCCQIYPTQVRRAFLIAEHLHILHVSEVIDFGNLCVKEMFFSLLRLDQQNNQITPDDKVRADYNWSNIGFETQLWESANLFYPTVNSAVRDHNWWKGCSTIRTGTGGDYQST